VIFTQILSFLAITFEPEMLLQKVNQRLRRLRF